MKLLRPSKKWIFPVIGLVLAFLVLKIVLFFTAEPKVTVNYLAEYNKLARPERRDPNGNADELYKKAAAAYVPPSELVLQARYKSYPDINEAEVVVLREWLQKNKACREHLEEASKKRFLWMEQNEKTGQQLTSGQLGPPNILELTGLLEQYAKVAAMDGDFKDGLTTLLECWRIGGHYTNPKLLMEDQVCGMLIKEHAMETAFQILDCLKPDVNDLRLWQESWQRAFDADDFIPGFQTERLVCYDLIQRNFLYDPKGNGRLAWKRAKYFTALCGGCYNRKVYLSCFIGPNSTQVSEIVTSVCDYYQSTVNATPWELRHSETEYAEKIEKMKVKWPMLNVLIPNPRPIWWCHYRVKARNGAFVTVIAALRYKADHGNYPQSLEVLLKDKYLTKLPRDPFEEGPLVYHLLDGDFELYSVGQDFSDDGGKRFQGGNPLTGAPYGDEVFWPPFRTTAKNMKFLSHTKLSNRTSESVCDN